MIDANLCVAGQNIKAGHDVLFWAVDGKVYSHFGLNRSEGKLVGVAVENIREGFRIAIKDGKVREVKWAMPEFFF